MTTTVITACDLCNKDITYSGASDLFRIVLTCERAPLDPNVRVIEDVAIRPPIEKGTKHFCSLACLRTHVAHL